MDIHADSSSVSESFFVFKAVLTEAFRLMMVTWCHSGNEGRNGHAGREFLKDTSDRIYINDEGGGYERHDGRRVSRLQEFNLK